MSERDDVRKAIETQVCPWCSRGPFRSLASHTSKVHEVTADDLRKVAGLARKDSVTSRETRELTAEIARTSNHTRGHEGKGGAGRARRESILAEMATLAIDSARTGEPCDQGETNRLVNQLHHLDPVSIHAEGA